MALRLEERVLNDAYFADRKLFPNADFYNGILMRAIGIPRSMFTVIFAIGRMPGWIAHWKEQREAPEGRIVRPRQLYIGPRRRPTYPSSGAEPPQSSGRRSASSGLAIPPG